MWDETGRYVVVFNGEIYNYKELREQYEKSGFHFLTQSDTEILLAGFSLKREKICADLNGMFAFAIWDTEKKELFLARDHLGKKPLYWCVQDGVFYFSSTLDSFTDIPGWDKKISAASVALFSLFGNFPEGTTIYKNAFELPYASYAFVKPLEPKLTPHRYWRPRFSPPSHGSLDDNLNKYESILTDAVNIRLRSDVPLALSFSGGVDSGTIAALCSKKFNRSVRCYTIDYHTEKDPSEETLIAQEVAKSLNLEWEHVQFNYHQNLLQELPMAYSYYDQPNSQLPLAYSQRLYETIKSRATVVLSGNGSDELFTGYIGDEKVRRREILIGLLAWSTPLLRTFFKLSGQSQLKSLLAYFFLSAPQAYEMRLLNRLRGLSLSSEDIELIRHVATQIANEARECNVAQLMDMRMFMDVTCTTGCTNYRIPDVSGLAAQVEVRSPFLDYRLVQFAATLPHNQKVGNIFSPTLNKYLPKVYYERYLPKRIVWAKKKGMGANLRWDLSIKTDPSFFEAFQRAFQSIDEIGLDATPYRKAWHDYRSNKSDNSDLMMAGFMLGAWLQRGRPS